jgi:hypothetical protein
VIITKEAIDLIREGESLNKISKSTGIGKSTLYFHYKKIKGKKTIPIKIDFSNEEKTGEFIGMFAGDGGFYLEKEKYQYKIRIYLGLYEKQYSSYVKNFLTELFSKPPRSYRRMSYGVEVIEYYSKDIYKLIKEYLDWDDNKTKTIRLKDTSKLNKNFLIGFIRGIFDTDGGIHKKKNKVAFGTASGVLANQIREILTKQGLPPGFYKYKNKEFWYVDLYGERTDKFMKLIKPNNSNKIINKTQS